VEAQEGIGPVLEREFQGQVRTFEGRKTLKSGCFPPMARYGGKRSFRYRSGNPQMPLSVFVTFG
jgi:hypothetical protein